uniref:IRF tryptophan pentad repeat domain-containing protein n=1 Tax=Ciona intestinalis TaxID=7719 RepID=F6T5R3_CIOIN
MTDDNEYKLPLRHWLVKKIEESAFDGLEWVNREEKTFKIPWTQKKYPNWEKHCEIFKAWAKHRGSTNLGDPFDFKKLKGNFRCALNKSDDFEEIKERNVSDQQTGNYKIYRLLDKSEVTEKRAQRKRSTAGSSGSNKPPAKQHKRSYTPDTSGWPGGSSVSVKSEYKQELEQKINSDIEQQLSNSMSSSQMDHADQYESGSIFSESINQFHQTISMPSESCSTNLTLLNNFPTNRSVIQQNVSEQISFQNFSNILSPEHVILASPEAAPVDQLYEQPPSFIRSVHPAEEIAQSLPTFETFLQGFNLSREDMLMYKVTLKYNGMVVKSEKLSLAKGVRFMFGSPLLQKNVVEAFRSGERELVDLQTWEFPEQQMLSSNSANIDSILKSTDLGIVLQAQQNGLTAKRLCQSQIFYFDQSNQGGHSVKLERKVAIEVLSHAKWVRSLLEQQRGSNTISPNEGSVKLVIGTKPSSIRSVGLVSLTIQSACADILIKQFSDNDNPSVLASNESSLDVIIRMLDQWAVDPDSNFTP